MQVLLKASQMAAFGQNRIGRSDLEKSVGNSALRHIPSLLLLVKANEVDRIEH